VLWTVDTGVRFPALARTRTVRGRKAGMAKDEEWQGGPIGGEQRRKDEIERRERQERADKQRAADEARGKSERERDS